MLHQRLIFGTLLASGIIGLLLTDGYLAQHPLSYPIGWIDGGGWFSNGALCTLLVLTLTLLAVSELTTIFRNAGYRPFRFETHFFSAGLVLGPYLSYNLQAASPWKDESWGLLWMAVALANVFLVQAVRRGTEKVLTNLSTSIFIIFYAGGLAGFMTKLRMEIGGVEGVTLLLYSMFVVKMTDVGAYFVGKVLGRTKFVPWLSPKKTWEGLLGGYVVAVISAFGGAQLVLYCGLAPHYEAVLTPGWLLLAFALLMATFSTAGDLCESLIKRDADVKDSGRAIPGMGGVLDILDSPLLAAPAAWFFWARVVPMLNSLEFSA